MEKQPRQSPWLKEALQEFSGKLVNLELAIASESQTAKADKLRAELFQLVRDKFLEPYKNGAAAQRREEKRRSR